MNARLSHTLAEKLKLIFKQIETLEGALVGPIS
jgi:hypothetical protein